MNAYQIWTYSIVTCQPLSQILKQSRMSEKQIQADEEAILPDNDQTAEAIARRKVSGVMEMKRKWNMYVYIYIRI